MQQPPTPQQMERIREGMLAMGAAMARAMKPAIAAAAEFGRKFHAAMWTAYRADGMPYGETEEGLMRWVEEQGQKNRARAEAEHEAMRGIPLRRPDGTAL